MRTFPLATSTRPIRQARAPHLQASSCRLTGTHLYLLESVNEAYSTTVALKIFGYNLYFSCCARSAARSFKPVLPQFPQWLLYVVTNNTHWRKPYRVAGLLRPAERHSLAAQHFAICSPQRLQRPHPLHLHSAILAHHLFRLDWAHHPRVSPTSRTHFRWRTPDCRTGPPKAEMARRSLPIQSHDNCMAVLQHRRSASHRHQLDTVRCRDCE
jgi:hypothetical protein